MCFPWAIVLATAIASEMLSWLPLNMGSTTPVLHYMCAGRLGLKMPETAALLKMGWPEWQSFHWGLGTLTHGDTARVLWRAGLPKAKVAPS